MKYCSNCGNTAPDDAEYCSVCGTTFDDPRPGTQVSRETSTNSISSELAPIPAEVTPPPPQTTPVTVITQTIPQPAVAPPKKEKKKGGCGGCFKRLIIGLVVLCIITIAIAVIGTNTKERDDEPWPNSVLAQMLPKAKDTCNRAYFNDSYVDITLENVTKKDFQEYVEACKEKGFTEEADYTDSTYTAYNKDAYELSVFYFDTRNKSMDITLNTPKAAGDLIWPNKNLATLLPNPNKTKGNVEYNNTTQLLIYVGEVSQEEFEAYINQCSETGFDLVSFQANNYYSAEDKQGNELRVEYLPMNIMSIYVETPEAFADTKSSNTRENLTDITPEAASENETTPTSSTTQEVIEDSSLVEKAVSAASGAVEDAVTPEFKEYMDGYETFIDDYIAFIQSYENSDDVMSMLSDYTDMMTRYTETMEALNSVDTDSLSAADELYYLEVMSRIEMKLASASLG